MCLVKLIKIRAFFKIKIINYNKIIIIIINYKFKRICILKTPSSTAKTDSAQSVFFLNDLKWGAAILKEPTEDWDYVESEIGSK